MKLVRHWDGISLQSPVDGCDLLFLMDLHCRETVASAHSAGPKAMQLIEGPNGDTTAEVKGGLNKSQQRGLVSFH